MSSPYEVEYAGNDPWLKLAVFVRMRYLTGMVWLKSPEFWFNIICNDKYTVEYTICLSDGSIDGHYIIFKTNKKVVYKIDIVGNYLYGSFKSYYNTVFKKTKKYGNVDKLMNYIKEVDTNAHINSSKEEPQTVKGLERWYEIFSIKSKFSITLDDDYFMPQISTIRLSAKILNEIETMLHSDMVTCRMCVCWSVLSGSCIECSCGNSPRNIFLWKVVALFIIQDMNRYHDGSC